MIILKKVLSLGYDLGDGETVIDAVTFEYDPDNSKIFDKSHLLALRMPDTDKPGEAIPTGYGYNKNNQIVFGNSIIARPQSVSDIHSYFKRKPKDLLGNISTKRYSELEKIFSTDKWPSQSECPEVYTDEFKKFKKCVQEFTNAIFSSDNLKSDIELKLVNCDEIIICVGHPTKWDNLDAAIYRTILKGSILGNEKYLEKPCSFILAKESRAAYLYLKDLGTVQNTPAGTCSLLIDVGSSTIDVTAVTQDSRNYSYNDGNNYLGVRSIDFMIRDWYFERLNAEGVFEKVNNLIKNNPSQENAVVLKCRKAKETAYSTAAGAIGYGLINIELEKNTIDKLASTVSVVKILNEITKISPEDSTKFGNKDWMACFKQYLETQKSALKKLDLPIGRIIITGGASKMTFIPPIIKKVFSEVPENEIHVDQAASQTISRGLALVGPYDTKSQQFQKRIEELNETEIPQIISTDLIELANAISPIIENIITAVVLRRVKDWRKGYLQTINDMSNAIKEDLSEENLKGILKNDASYQDEIENWTVSKLGKDIAQKLKQICDEYHVTEFTVDDLNVMKNVSVFIKRIS